MGAAATDDSGLLTAFPSFQSETAVAEDLIAGVAALQTIPTVRDQVPVQFYMIGERFVDRSSGVQDVKNTAGTPDLPGLSFAFQSVSDLEAALGVELNEAERSMLTNGGALVVNPDRVALTSGRIALVNNTSMREVAELDAMVVTPEPTRWTGSVPFVLLRTTADDLGLPTLPGAILYTDIPKRDLEFAGGSAARCRLQSKVDRNVEQGLNAPGSESKIRSVIARFIGAAALAVAVIPFLPGSSVAHDGTTTSPLGIVSSDATIFPSRSYDDAFNGYRIFLSSPRHANSGSRGECMNPGRQENINGRNWNWYAANGNYVGSIWNPASRIRNFHARGFGVRVSRNTRDNGYADNVVSSVNFGADLHTVTHTNANNGCTDPADYFLALWNSYGDQLQCNAYSQYFSPYVPGGEYQWQAPSAQYPTNLAELSRNAPNGDCYLDLQFHTNQSRQTWIHNQTPHEAWRYGFSIDQAMGYP